MVDKPLLLTQNHQRKGTKMINFQKKEQQILHKQTNETKQLKEIVTLEYNYSSSQTAELHPLLKASRDDSTLQP